MDPHTSSQDLVCCDLCETANVQMHCDTCSVNLCKACVGEHISTDGSKDHKVVKFQSRKSILLYPGCDSHKKERCEMYCKHCDTPVCHTCLASDQHLNHKLSKILQVLGKKKDMIKKEQTEFNETIYPTYQDIATDIQNRISQLEKEYGDLSTAITKHGEDWHREIDKLVHKLKDKVDENKSEQLQKLQKHLGEINKIIADIKDEIDSFDITVDSKDISRIFSVKSKVDHYKKIPSKLVLSVPKFTPGKIQEEKLFKLFGTLSSISITKEKHGYRMKTTQESPEVGSPSPVPLKLPVIGSPSSVKQKSPEFGSPPSVSLKSSEVGSPPSVSLKSSEVGSPSLKQHSLEVVSPSSLKLEGTPPSVSLRPPKVSSPPPVKQKSPEVGSSPPFSLKSPEGGSLHFVKKLLHEPQIFRTGIESFSLMVNIACLSNEKIWICDNGNTMKLYSIKEDFRLIYSITTKSGNIPADMAVTRSGDLIYTDNKDRTVNIVGKKGIEEEVIKLQNWKPRGVCSTSCGDLLVTLNSDDNKQSKVVQFSGSLEHQSIQFDDKGVPLYSSGGSDKHICENRNLDICVADHGAKAVVVVNQAGKLRFRYNGYESAPLNKAFNPKGITTDNQAYILTSDYANHCVHIIDKDGKFLRYLELELRPYRLCTDTDDNLFVAVTELKSGSLASIEKIKYLQ